VAATTCQLLFGNSNIVSQILINGRQLTALIGKRRSSGGNIDKIFGSLGCLGGVVVRSQTSDSEVMGLIATWTAVELSNNLEQVIYTRGAQANSAFLSSGIGKLDLQLK